MELIPLNNNAKLKLGKQKSNNYFCHICQKDFTGPNDLRKHLRIHTGERPFPCTHCGRCFRQAGCLKNHVASLHGTDTLFICYYCNKSFPIKERLRLHMRIHSGEKPYKCQYCGKNFARGGQLKQHIITHYRLKNIKIVKYSRNQNNDYMNYNGKRTKGEGNFMCDICGQHFYRSETLKKHIITFHSNGKVYRCKICKKILKGHLLQHMLTHEKHKPLGCADCGATFSQRCQLIVHQRVHSGERPYRCQVCWKAFAYSYVLKLHIRKHTGEKPFKCPLCIISGIAFAQLSHLKTHMRAIHKTDKSYMCDTCKELFKSKNELLQHNSKCSANSSDGKISSKKIKGRKNEIGCGVDAIAREEAAATQAAITSPTILLNNKTNFKTMSITKIRLLVAILLKKILTEERLQKLGYEKRLIDNVLISALIMSGQSYCDDNSLSEFDRLTQNVYIFLEFTVPTDHMDKYKNESRDIEELLEELTSIKIETD